MWNKIWKRFLREPMWGLLVVLLTLCFSVVLGHMEKNNQEELWDFEETYRTVPVYFEVTDLAGGRVKDSNGIEGWVVELFSEDGKLTPNFSELMSDIQLRMESFAIADGLPEEDNLNVDFRSLVGISSTKAAEELTEEYGGSIRWCEGYGEDILQTEDFVCLVPEGYSDGEVQLSFLYVTEEEGRERGFTFSFQVAGYYTDSGNQDIYCPYDVVERIFRKQGEKRRIQYIGATLKDNEKLKQLQETADYWFAKPNPLGKPTEWGRFDYEYYLYAMDINDTLLQNLVSDMERSIRINRWASGLIFLMAAGSGFLNGFLVIRTRKREVMLMRTLGNPAKGIFLEFAMEHIICMLIGAFIGSCYGGWYSLDRIAIFVSIAFVGMSIALGMFLHKSLLPGMKEDE